jgi:hypothetical protein
MKALYELLKIATNVRDVGDVRAFTKMLMLAYSISNSA